MNTRSLCGRADLLRLQNIEEYEEEDLIKLAAFIGFDWAPIDPLVEQKEGDRRPESFDKPTDHPAIEFSAAEPRDVPFLQPTIFIDRGTTSELSPPRREIVEWRNPPTTGPKHPPLALWRNLEAPLRSLLNLERETTEVDVARATKEIAKRLRLERVPRRHKRRWPAQLEVIVDRSSHLAPIWADQRYVVAHLQRILPDAEINLAGISAGDASPQYANERYRDWTAEPGGLVVALTDFGTFASDWSVATDRWLRIGHEILAAGGRAVALVPCPENRVGSRLRQTWSVMPWERPTPALLPEPSQRADLLRRLNVLLSPAVRIEPGLLRTVRLAFVPEADASLELAFWDQPLIESTNIVAATIGSDKLTSLRRDFAALDPEVRRSLLGILKSWRPPELKTIWFEEVLSAATHSVDQLPCREDLEDARDYMDVLAHRHLRGLGPHLSTGSRAWIYRVDERARASIRHPSFLRLADAIRAGSPEATTDDNPAAAIEQLFLYQRGADLAVTASQAADPAAALLAQLPADTGLLDVLDAHGTGGAPDISGSAFWKGGEPPTWAEDWGSDEYGAWVTFAVEAEDGQRITQQLRWIPPGRFLMGSPKSEPGRNKNEGPQHEVKIREGFWLFATPVTQALYETVTGENPSYFVSPTRPVDSVALAHANGFMARLSGRLPGLNLTLPSEAQWEYACRAGTTTATYAGPMEILGKNNAPILDAIAWYGGNSGVGFDLEKGVNSSNWTGTQYAHARTGTRPVSLKRPNPWGLFDMLGNVKEWCSDHWYDNYQNAPVDGNARTDINNSWIADRVVRGGSWDSLARQCRSATRASKTINPNEASARLGFRPARGQGARSDGTEAVPVEAAWKGRGSASQQTLGTARSTGASDLTATHGWRQSPGGTTIAVAPSGTLIATGDSSGVIRIVNAETGEELRQFKGHSSELYGLAFSPDGRSLLSTGKDYRLWLWNINAGTQERLDGYTAWAYRASFSPDGQRFVTAARDGMSSVYRLSDRSRVFQLQSTPLAMDLHRAIFSPDGRSILAAADDDTARVFDAKTGAEDTARVFDANAGAERLILRGHAGEVTSAAYSPDGRWVVTASQDGTARIWDAANGDHVRTLVSDDVTPLRSAGFDASSTLVFTLADGGGLQLWDGRSGERRLTLGQTDDPPADAVFHPTERALLTIADGFVRRRNIEEAAAATVFGPQAVRVAPGAKPQSVTLPRTEGFRVRSDRAELTFGWMTKPEWASSSGRDRYGLFAEIIVEEVTQRLRWIPPGRFLMGSPEDEPGRFASEGPQHEVTINEGFWLFSTPVTQGLYEAVTGGNSSRFKGADRPVENVSWHDARKFLDRLNDLVPGLDLVLPSEAQWEYACRAGTTTATYAGDLPDLENAGAEVLDGIAWFGENSGGETHPVALKTPNGWGLYDMLGNVWEWCADHWHESYDGAPSDGSAWLDENADPGAGRVLRGGSWGFEARYCRAAYRYGYEPAFRIFTLGFRPARGQA